MSKLHELLAVSGSLSAQAESCRAELMNTFEKKKAHFSEKLVTFKPTIEGEQERTEEQLGLQTTVPKELAWIGDKLAKRIDIGHQIDLANMAAAADVEIDGAVFLTSIPATSLLQLEKRLEEVQQLVQKIPTLDPTQGFKPCPDRGADVYEAREIIKDKTRKVQEFPVVVQATDKHPAQVRDITRDVKIGNRHEQEWSGLITVADKGDMLDRIENLLRAVKQARSKANDLDIDVKQNRIGKTILDYIFTIEKN